MSNKELIKIISLLKTAYPYAFKEMSAEELRSLLALYELHFKDCDYQLLEKAIFQITSTDEYLPSIARIKKEIANLQMSDFPKAEDEWNHVIYLVHKYGSYNEEKALNEMSEYTRYITSHIGFRNICLSEDQTWNKKEFIGEYNELQDKNIKNLQIGNSSLFQIEMKKRGMGNF